MNGLMSGVAALLGVSLFSFTTTTAAQEQQGDDAWSFSLGAGAMYRPDYDGSDDH